MMSHLLSVILCIVLASIAESVTREEAEEVIRQLSTDCLQSTGATAEDLEAMIKHEPPKTSAGKCLAECMMKKFGTITDDGKFSKPHLMSVSQMILKDDQAKLKIVEEIIDDCLHLTDPDHCELAIKFGGCLHKAIIDKKINIDW